LKDLPKGLNETYENILLKISRSDVEIVRRILLWLAFAVLPLTLEELHTAIAIEQDKDGLDEDSLLSSPQDILTLCGSLISLSEQGNVRLAHLSVKDYLVSSDACLPKYVMNSDDGNLELAMDCLTYLSYKSLLSGPSRSETDYIERVSQHPFIQHAATGWTYYVRATKSSAKLDEFILDFFSTRSHEIFMSWVQAINARHSSHWDFYPRHATPLYYAASFGLTEMVRRLIKTGVNLNAPGSRFGGAALHAAVIRHHIEVLKLLLENGADPNHADFNHASPLHSAASYGYVEVASILMEYGASKNALDQMGETPYDWAVFGGQRDVQKLLQGLPVERTESGRNDSGQIVWKARSDWREGPLSMFSTHGKKRWTTSNSEGL
jgi:hypothetical protein